ncbi:hypothetical protein PR048_002683 [Dryococelus australis]|uniref:Uncharacterized protein n=1 Tax=Dryococelus australis TaxID=614101 RepID=A0ABQ9ILK9_9NEOP|nr:hypothetical protein PR048_002683 [Dryococelus australis]
MQQLLPLAMNHNLRCKKTGQAERMELSSASKNYHDTDSPLRRQRDKHPRKITGLVFGIPICISRPGDSCRSLSVVRGNKQRGPLLLASPFRVAFIFAFLETVEKHLEKWASSKVSNTLATDGLRDSKPGQARFKYIPHTLGATVGHCSPPSKANQVQFPAGSLQTLACENRAGRCSWSAGFLWDAPRPLPFHSGAASYSHHFTLSGSQDLCDKNHPNIFTHSLHPTDRARELLPAMDNKVSESKRNDFGYEEDRNEIFSKLQVAVELSTYLVDASCVLWDKTKRASFYLAPLNQLHKETSLTRGHVNLPGLTGGAICQAVSLQKGPRRRRRQQDYNVKPPRAAIRVPKRSDRDTKRTWICFWESPFTTHQQWLLEVRGEQVAGQPYPNEPYVQRVTYQANVQAWEAVIPVVH